MIRAEKILALRRNGGWSQEELADKLNVSRQSISKWEGAQSIPDINKILEVAKLFGVTTDRLLKDDVETASDTQEDDSKPPRISVQETKTFMEEYTRYAKRIAQCGRCRD